MFIVAFTWAAIGKVDIVAIAQGKIIPSEHVKQIQSLESARIRHIYVREGSEVQTGELLLELDSSHVQGELERIDAELSAQRSSLIRLRLLSQWLAEPLITNVLDQLAPELPAEQLSLLIQERAEVEAQLASFENQTTSAQAETKVVLADVRKKQQVIPVLQERVNALNILQKKSYGSKLQYLALQQELIEEQQDLARHKARIVQLEVSQEGIKGKLQHYLSEKRKQTQAQLNQLQVQLQSLEIEHTKVTNRLEHFSLKSPIDGQVQQLAVHTVAGVVSPAQVLLSIVPRDSKLEVEALIVNKDIGFIREGQAVELKINTFNFTKYGFINGHVMSISDDAIQHETLGLVYSARIALHEDGLKVENSFVRLTPGMAVSAEIKTGQRRVIEFFLSPLLRYQQESLGER